MTKLKPILFSTEMVQAILEDRKTMTRRVIKPQPKEIGNDKLLFEDRERTKVSFLNECKYQINDILWVKETYFDSTNHKDAILFKDSEKFIYKADGTFIGCHKWKSSLFMPKEAARIFLKVTNIRVERLHDISEEDAIAEGVEKIADYGNTGYKLYTEPDAAYSDIDALDSFESLWTAIKGEDSWKENPYVWVIEFERVAKPENI